MTEKSRKCCIAVFQSLSLAGGKNSKFFCIFKEFRETKGQKRSDLDVAKVEETQGEKYSLKSSLLETDFYSTYPTIEVLNSTKAIDSRDKTIEVTGRNQRGEDETRCSSFLPVRNFPTRVRPLPRNESQLNQSGPPIAIFHAAITNQPSPLRIECLD